MHIDPMIIQGENQVQRAGDKDLKDMSGLLDTAVLNNMNRKDGQSKAKPVDPSLPAAGTGMGSAHAHHGPAPESYASSRPAGPAGSTIPASTREILPKTGSLTSLA